MSLLAQALKQADEMGKLPENVDLAFIGTKVGDALHVGMVARINKHWTLIGDVGMVGGKITSATGVVLIDL